MNEITMGIQADELIRLALREDITNEDISTNSIMPKATPGQAELICKQDGMLAGLPVFERVFKILDPGTKLNTSLKDGAQIKKGQLLGVVTGDIRVLLSGERVALNYLQRMSGIATYTHNIVKLLKDCKTVLLDTRKTSPNNRLFEKYAVKVGGGSNHRYNLSDGILLKDNHIAAAGGIARAIKNARDYAPFVRKIEVEVECLKQVQQALDAGADIIMLDNMGKDEMRQAVELINGRAQTECSGNVTAENVAELGDLGLDFISCGALTHSASILDISMKNLKTV